MKYPKNGLLDLTPNLFCLVMYEPTVELKLRMMTSRNSLYLRMSFYQGIKTPDCNLIEPE